MVNGFDTTGNRSEGNSPIRVLMQNRSNTFTQRGGDTLLMENLIHALEAKGVKVTVDLIGAQDPKNFDIVHLFNFVLPEMLKHFGEQAQKAGVPFVVTTLAEDVPEFHNRSINCAAALMQYTEMGQDRAWWKANNPSKINVERAPRFENSWTAANAAALFTNGAGETAVIRREYSNVKRIAEIPLGYQAGARGDKETFVREYGISDFVLCVGRIETRKNQLMLLKALEDSDLTVVLAGGGFTYQPSYDQAVRNFRRRGKTIVLDRISPAMLASAYCAARVHVLPSWYELPGLVTLEAASYGCPIVVSDTGTTADYVGSSGWYVDPASELSILNAVYAAYYGPAKAGLKEVAMKYSWDKTAEETLKEYQQILGASVSKPAEAAAPVRTIDIGQFDMGPAKESEFDALLEQGEEAARTRQYNLAHELFEKAERLNSKSVRALRARGAVYMAENLINQARRYFEAALRLNASDAKSLSGIGMCDLHEGKTEDAYNNILKALEIDPYQLVAILQLVQCSYLLERFDSLESVLRRYLAQSPQDLEMRYCLAGCLFKRDKIEESSVELKDILAKNPLHEGAVQLQQMIAERKPATRIVETDTPAAPAEGPFSGAIRELENEKHDRQFQSVLTRTEGYLARGGMSAADTQTMKCLRAEAMVFTSQIREADDLFAEVLAGAPDCVRALCGRGAIASAENFADLARGYFEKAVAISPRNDVALAGLAMIEQGSGNTEKAWTLYRDSLSINPENSRALYGVIELGYFFKRFAEIEESLKAYLDYHPGDINYVYSLAGCLYAQGRYDEAAEEVGRVLIFDPQNSNALDLQKLIDERFNGRQSEVQQERASTPS